MSKLTCIETYIDQDQLHYGSFLIEPLEIGQGITLGNSLRRTLLSDLSSYAISAARINDLKNEFSAVEGLREDILEVLLNLKEIVFKNLGTTESLKKLSFQGFLNAKGPIIVTAGMFNLPKNCLKILNPNQYICTITDTSEFFLHVLIEKGKGYRLSDEIRKKAFREKVIHSRSAVLFLDAIFMPVKKVNYKIKLIHDTNGNIKESLILEVFTNGSISPKRSLQEALKILMNLLYPLFINPTFFKVSENYKKK